MTNFYQSNPELGTAGQDRFELAQKFRSGNSISFDKFRQLLSKGERSLTIQELFGESLPYKKEYEKFLREDDIRNDLRRGDYEIAAEKIKKWFYENSDFDMHTEGSLNALGYQLMGAEELDGAITIFELNVELYPEAANTYDSLGEAFMNADRIAEAIINYRKSLKLDPSNTIAIGMLKRLENPE